MDEAIFGLASGLLGAVIGSTATFTGQLYLGGRQTDRRRKGMIRALLGELRLNAGNINRAVRLKVYSASVSQRVWFEANFEIAQFLPDSTYFQLQAVYADVADIQRFSETKSDEDLVRIRSWIGHVVEAESMLLAIKHASDFREKWLELRGIRDQFEDALEEHRRSVRPETP